VLRDGGKAHLVGFREFADRGVTTGQLFDDGPPNRVCQGGKDGAQVDGCFGSVNHLVKRCLLEYLTIWLSDCIPAPRNHYGARGGSSVGERSWSQGT